MLLRLQVHHITPRGGATLQMDDVKEKLEDHEERIRSLEINGSVLAEQLKNVCNELHSLVSWIKAFVLVFVTAGIGFFFWYIQQLSQLGG
jgi:hypothetical protein